jgi:maleate cis-trans isomerase
MALRIGLMVPENNTTMEPELLAWLPQGTACTTLRIPRDKGTLTLADIPAYASKAEAMAVAFAEQDVDLVVYGCTAAGILAGPGRDAEISSALSEITGKPTVTTASAMVASLHHDDARSIALVTPYSDLVNERLKAFLAHADIRVRNLSSFGAASVDELGAIDSAAVAARAREAMDADCNALFIACSQLPTLAILDGLQDEFGRPVWSSIKATAWQACRALGRAFARQPQAHLKGEHIVAAR